VSLDPSYPYKVAGFDANGGEIRKFADDGIQSAIDKALADAALGPDDHGAIVAYNDGSTIRGALVYKVPLHVGHDFTFAGVVSHDLKTGDTGFQAAVRLRF
jgi:hypothetical protein